MTEWRVISGYERYEVSDDGRVRNLTSGREVRPTATTRGYLRVAMRPGPPRPYERGKSSRPKEMKVHRLVALAFIPNPEGLPEVNHRDLNKHNNSLSNLEWVTHIDNHVHCLTMGKYNAVEFEERRRKLTPEHVVELRQMRQAGASLAACGARFNVCESTAGKIARGRSWPALDGAVATIPRVSVTHVTEEDRQRLLALLPASASELGRTSGLGQMVTYALLDELLGAGRVTRSRVKTKLVYRARSHRLVVPSNDHTQGEEA